MDYGNWYLSWSDTDSDINLSGMSGLKTINMRSFNFKSITLPSGVNSITFEDCASFPNLSNLNSLTYLRFAKGGTYDYVAASNVISSLSSKIWDEDERIELQLVGLREISDLSNILNKFNTTSLKIVIMF